MCMYWSSAFRCECSMANEVIATAFGSNKKQSKQNCAGELYYVHTLIHSYTHALIHSYTHTIHSYTRMCTSEMVLEKIIPELLEPFRKANGLKPSVQLTSSSSTSNSALSLVQSDSTHGHSSAVVESKVIEHKEKVLKTSK